MQKIHIDGMQIYRFEWNYINSNMYAIEAEDSVLVIDPVETDETMRFWRYREKNIANVTVILTHEHFDHVNGLNYLRSNFDCTVISSVYCSKNITDTRKNLSEYSLFLKIMNEDVKKSETEILPFACKPADIIFKYGMDRKWMGHQLNLILTPGHTQGSICISWDGRVLFTGDSLLKKAIITRAPSGSKKDYVNITRGKLLALLKQIEVVCPGHGEPDIADRFKEFI